MTQKHTRWCYPTCFEKHKQQEMADSRNEGEPRAKKLREVFKLYPKMHDTVVPALLAFAPKPVTQTTKENADRLANLFRHAATAFIITERAIMQKTLEEFFIDHLKDTFSILSGDDEPLVAASVEAYGKLLERGLPTRPESPTAFQAYFTHLRSLPSSEAPRTKLEQLTAFLGNTVYQTLPLLQALAAFETTKPDTSARAAHLVEFAFLTIATQGIVIAKTSVSKAWMISTYDGIIEILAGEDGALIQAAKQLSRERIDSEYGNQKEERISK